MFGFDEANSRRAKNVNGPSTGIQKHWTADISTRITGAPIVSGDNVFVCGVGGGVTSVSRKEGTIEWTRPELSTVSSSPALTDGTTILGTKESVVALDVDDGSTKWSYDEGNLSHSSSPCISDGSVYIGCGWELTSISNDSGKVNWTFETEGAIAGTPAVADNIVYIGSSDDYLYAVDVSSGEVRWRSELGSSIQSSPVVGSGTVYVGELDGLVHAFDKETGDKRWSVPVGPVYSSIARAGSRLFVPTFSTGSHGGLYAVEEGTVQWSFQPDSLGCKSAPAIAGSTVYVGHQNGKVYAVNANDGTEVWRYDTGTSAVDSSPTVIEDGLYIGDDSGALHALTAD
jgi:outer membrane protein assembly factor BamB